MTLSIPLGRGLVAIIDEADLAKVSGREWRAQTNGPKDRRRIYAVSGNPRDPSDPLIFMHRLIANTPGDLETDHRNRNTLDNRRDNLRPCTSSQNQANRGPNRNNTSGYRGVSWCKADQCWVATIRVNYRKIWLGRFVEIEDAVAAYQAAAALYFGEFAAHVSDDASFCRRWAGADAGVGRSGWCGGWCGRWCWIWCGVWRRGLAFGRPNRVGTDCRDLRYRVRCWHRRVGRGVRRRFSRICRATPVIQEGRVGSVRPHGDLFAGRQDLGRSIWRREIARVLGRHCRWPCDLQA